MAPFLCRSNLSEKLRALAATEPQIAVHLEGAADELDVCVQRYVLDRNNIPGLMDMINAWQKARAIYLSAGGVSTCD